MSDKNNGKAEGEKKIHPGSENLKPFKKGVSGNPKGRPKGQKNISTILRELMDTEILYEDSEGINKEVDMGTAIAINLAKTATQGIKDEHRLKATDMIMDRLEGKPTQYIEKKEVPATNEEAMERIKDIAQQEGVSVEEICDREGIEYG